MSEIKVIRTPLEERISRLRKCASPSIEYSEWIMRRVCNTSILEALRTLDAEKEEAALREAFIQRLHRNPDTVTIGELAVLISGWYMNISETKNVDAAIYLTAMYTYFSKQLSSNFDYSRRSRNKGISAEDADHALEMICMPVCDYMDIIMQLDMPAISKEWIADYITNGDYDDYTETSMLFKNVLDGQRLGQEPLSKDNAVKIAKLEGRDEGLLDALKPLIYAMVMPMAIMATDAA